MTDRPIGCMVAPECSDPACSNSGGVFDSPQMSDRPQNLAALLKAFPRPLWVLFFGTFLNKFGTFVIPFLALYLKGRGFSIAQAGLAISAYGFGNFLASAVGGHLADSLGRRNTIVCSMFSVAVSMLLLIGAGLFLRTLYNLKTQDVGYNPDHLLIMRVDPVSAGYRGDDVGRAMKNLLDRIRALPGVRSVTFSENGLF